MKSYINLLFRKKIRRFEDICCIGWLHKNTGNVMTKCKRTQLYLKPDSEMIFLGEWRMGGVHGKGVRGKMNSHFGQLV